MAEHRGMDRWYFYPLVFMFGFFPWSAFIAAGFSHALSSVRKRVSKKTSIFLLSIFFTPFFFFMLAKSKLMSYIFPLYPVAALLAGAWAWRIYRAFRLGYSPRPVFGLMVLAFLGLMPAALVAGAYFFAVEQKLSILGSIVAIALTLIPLSWLGLFFFWSKKLPVALATMLVAILSFSSLSFGFMMPAAGAAFSSKGWAEDYGHLMNRFPDSLFLASKMFVRGMTYYTGSKNMGVFSGELKGGFYTAHPIAIFSDADELMRLGRQNFPIYLLIRQKELRHLREGLEPGFTVSILEQSPGRTLARLDHV